MNHEIRSALKRAQRQARALQGRLGELNVPVAYGQALEAVAAVQGYQNWHAYRAKLVDGPFEAPPPATPVGDSNETWACYRVGFYSEVSSFQGHALLASREVLARSLEEAVRLLAPGTVPALYTPGKEGQLLTRHRILHPDVRPSLLVITDWLRDEDVTCSDLDEMVIDLACEQGASDASEESSDEDQDDTLSASERLASEVNNEGLSAQVNFLRKGFGCNQELVQHLKSTLGLRAWPFALDRQADAERLPSHW